MSTKTITKTFTFCDGCGKDLTERHRETYQLDLKSASWSEYHNERYQNIVSLEFCEACARDIKATLKKLAEGGDE